MGFTLFSLSVFFKKHFYLLFHLSPYSTSYRRYCMLDQIDLDRNFSLYKYYTLDQVVFRDCSGILFGRRKSNVNKM